MRKIYFIQILLAFLYGHLIEALSIFRAHVYEKNLHEHLNSFSFSHLQSISQLNFFWKFSDIEISINYYYAIWNYCYVSNPSPQQNQSLFYSEGHQILKVRIIPLVFCRESAFSPQLMQSLI